MDNYHLSKKGDNWTLTREQGQRASITAPTKAEAIAKTREFMSNKVGSVKIHKENGRFQEERTYQKSNDPRSSKG